MAKKLSKLAHIRFASLILLLVIASLQCCSTFVVSKPAGAPEINVLSVEKSASTIVFAGYLREGLLQIPLYGYIKEGEARAYVPGKIYGLAKRVRVFGNIAIVTGYIYSFRTKNMAILVSLMLLNGTRPPLNLVVSSCDNTFGSDALIDGDSLVVVGYTYCTLNETTGAVIHQVAGYRVRTRKAGESDVAILRFSLKNLSLVDFRLIGSQSFDDIPTLILRRGDAYYVIGETWAYNVSQADVFVAVLDRELNMVKNFAVGGASYETPFDAAFLGSDLLITGYTTSGETGDDGFAVLLSTIGGIKKALLLSSKGNDHLQYVSLTKSGRVVISGDGEINEDRSDSLLVTLDPADLSVEKFELVRTAPGNDTLIFLSKGGELVVRGGESRLADLQDRAVYCLGTNCSDMQVFFLNDTGESNMFVKKLASWRTSYNVLRKKSLAGKLYVDLVPSTPYKIEIAKSSLSIEESVFQRRVDWRKRVMRSLERNIPLLLILPIPLGLVVAYIIARRGSRLKPR